MATRESVRDLYFKYADAFAIGTRRYFAEMPGFAKLRLRAVGAGIQDSEIRYEAYLRQIPLSYATAAPRIRASCHRRRLRQRDFNNVIAIFHCASKYHLTSQVILKAGKI